jgi:hypothetical protein
MSDQIIDSYCKRVGYTKEQATVFKSEEHRVRQVAKLSKASGLYSIVAKVVESRNCNSGHIKGQKIVIDVDGNFITKLCPKRMCVYLTSQLTIPIALINERLNSSLSPGDFHFMKYVRCPDVGVDCSGYGEVTLKVDVVNRIGR